MLEIRIEGGASRFEPGERIRGTLSWAVESPPSSLSLRLLWYTEGRGDQDVGEARALSLESPVAVESHAFDFAAPAGPYSCSGRLVSIRWALEAVIEPGGHVERVELLLAPAGREVELVPGGGSFDPVPVGRGGRG